MATFRNQTVSTCKQFKSQQSILYERLCKRLDSGNDAKVPQDIFALLDEFREDQVVSSLKLSRVLGVDFTTRLDAACRTTQEL